MGVGVYMGATVEGLAEGKAVSVPKASAGVFLHTGASLDLSLRETDRTSLLLFVFGFSLGAAEAAGWHTRRVCGLKCGSIFFAAMRQ